MIKKLSTLACMVLIFSSVQAQSTYLDSTFGNGGIVIPQGLVMSGTTLSKVLLQPDGKILVRDAPTQSSPNAPTEVRIHRLMPDGSFDTSFGTGGSVAIKSDANALFDVLRGGLNILPNGKILTGYCSVKQLCCVETNIVQLNADGSFDTTFGVNGRTTINEDLTSAGAEPLFEDVVVQELGSIILIYRSVNLRDYGYRILYENGGIKLGFETIRWWTTNNKDETYKKTLVLPNDKFLLGGGYVTTNNGNASVNEFVLSQLLINGFVDNNFGNNGSVTSDITNTQDFLSDLTASSDGAITASGISFTGNILLAKYMENGAPDPSFGTGGKRVLSGGANVNSSVAISETVDGNIVASYSSTAASGNGTEGTVARFLPNGDFDPTFSGDGIVHLSSTETNINSVFHDVVAMSDHRILACGLTSDVPPRVILARFLPEEGAVVWYRDLDNDTYGSQTDSIFSATPPIGYVVNRADCDDTKANINPGRPEICNNNIDDDCNGIIDEDSNPPIVICNEFTVVGLDENGLADVSTDYLDNATYDECSSFTLSTNISSFDCTDLGTHPVVLTATDIVGNSNSCIVQVSVSDKRDPVAVCKPTTTVVLDDTGLFTFPAQFLNNGSTDNCNIVSYASSVNQFTTNNIGLNTVVLIVTDQSGNSSSCSMIVEVVANSTGTSSLQSTFKISVTPNPSNGIFTLQMDEHIVCERVSIFNSMGQMIHEKQNPSSATMNIDLSDQAAGSYFLRLQHGNEVRMLKLMLVE